MRKARILIPTEVPDFWSHVNQAAFYEDLNHFVDSLISKINISDLNDWLLTISVTPQSSDKVGIAKRMTRFPFNKEFAVYVSVPIPDKNLAPYGIGEPSRPPFFKFVNEKYSYAIAPQFDAYEDLYSYTLETAKLAINFAFANGFTCNGKKIKFQN